MRVAVVASSIAAGIRIAKEVERVAGLDVFIIVCNARMQSRPLRWFRELVLAVNSFHWLTLAAKTWSYARPGTLIVLSRPLDDTASVECLEALQCDVGLHAANVIYRDATISSFRLGILNAHIGILPEYRGRSVAEWSVLQGDPTGVTVFFVDSGIDTGERIVLHEFVPPGGQKTVMKLKKMLFGCDARLYRKALEALMSPQLRFDTNDISEGRRYYVMSKVFTYAVNGILRTRANG